MKKRLVTGIIALTCFSVIGLRSVNAQHAHKFEVDIPFAFVLDGKTVPAGRYELGRIDPAKPNVLMIKNAETRMLRLLLTQRAQKERPSAETYLLFKRLGGKLYLSEIWTAGSFGGQIITSFASCANRVRIRW